MKRGESTVVVFNMPSPDRSNLVFSKVIYRNNHVEAIIDTGAGITVISPEFCKYLNLVPKKQWEGPKLLMANGSIVCPEGSVTLEIIITGIPVYVEAAVLPINGYKLLLGNDALRQLESISIIYGEGGEAVFSVAPEAEVDPEKGKDELGSIVNQESCVIPAYSVVTITAELNNVQTGPSGTRLMIEPVKKILIDKGFSVGHLLLPTEDHHDCLKGIQLVNFFRQDQWLSKGTVLGKIVPVEVVSESEKQDGNIGDSFSQNTKMQFEGVINEELAPEERDAAERLLRKRAGCFATSDRDLGQSNIVQHSIDTATHKPIHQAPYKSAWKERELTQNQVQHMQNIGAIEPSSSPWAAPVVLVKKKDGYWRFCVDYRKLNAITTRDVYPLPRIEDALSRLEGSRYFSIMDMQSGYWQVEVRPEDREKTVFITPDGLYQFKVMPFGLSNAPATFQRMMDVLLSGLKWNTCLVYLDDIVVFSKTVSEHLSRLDEVLARIQRANLKLKISKCSFFATSLKVLGYVVSGKGQSPDASKVLAVRNFPVPQNVKDVQSFLGFCTYYRRFICDFANIARPLSDLTKKNNSFVWANEQQNSFEALKNALQSSPILGHPNYELPMEIHCDASGYGLGAVLVQQQESGERVICYASRLLNKAETNYSVTERECLALIFAVQRFRAYIWGARIKVVTDHHALCWLMKKKDLSGRLARWSLQLQELDIEIFHRSGKLHSDADVLSRNPVDQPGTMEDIPTLMILSTDADRIKNGQKTSRWWRPILERL